MLNHRIEDSEHDLVTLVGAPHSIVRVLLKQILKNNGFKRNIFSTNGPQALRLIYELDHDIDFIIMDWDVPLINGIELLKIIKADPEKFMIPFLMLSTEGSVKQNIYALEEGADYYSKIPFTENNLTKYIQNVIASKDNPDINQQIIDKINHEKLLQNYDAAISLGSDLIKKYNDPKLSLLLGECLYEKQNYDNAERLIKQSLENCTNSKGLDLLGRIHAKKANYKKSTEYFSQAKKANPINIDRSINLAQSFFLQDMIPKGKKIINSLCSSNLSYYDMIKIAELYLKNGFIADVSVFLDVLDPIKETAYVFYAYTVKLSQIGEHKKCLQCLTKYIKLLPDEYLFLFHIGIIFLKKGKNKQARTFFERVLTLNSGYAPAKRCLAMVS